MIETLNCYGYMLPYLDSITEKFVHACRGKDQVVLDIGPAYGLTTIEALKKGARVTAVDLDKRHLDVLLSNVPENLKNNLELHVGKFPDIPLTQENSFDAVLAAGVLHYLPPHEMIGAIKQIYHILKPGGCLYFTCSTPYLGIFSDFIPEYLRRKKTGEQWPGYIINPSTLAPTLSKILPPIINLLEQDQACTIFESLGFHIDETIELTTEGWPKSRNGAVFERFGIIARK